MNNPAYMELTMPQRKDFLGKLIIAAQMEFYGECTEIVRQAENKGLFNEVKPISEHVPEIANDLDKPIIQTNY